jgi:uncharacterized protein YecE (DUF72 family)
MITSDFTYVRLLGDRSGIEQITTTWGADVIDRTGELRTWADFLEGLARALPDVGAWVFANNHYSGHAPAAVRRLAAILDVEA